VSLFRLIPHAVPYRNGGARPLDGGSFIFHFFDEHSWTNNFFIIGLVRVT
jgi:hypothetical protein